ncbi:unnamed protein product [Closterium sp. NIES-65]|nr:unnamed protein product [Closterium sp. NIES-65]
MVSPEFQPDGSRTLEKLQGFCQPLFAGETVTGEWWHYNAEGTLFPVLVKVQNVVSNGKNYMVCVWHDLTEIKRREAELEKAKEAAEAASQAKSHKIEARSIALESIPCSLREAIDESLSSVRVLALQKDLESPSPLVELRSFAGLRCLVVEDNPVNRMVVVRLLGSLQVTCDVAEDGVKAVEACQAKEYDVIFMVSLSAGLNLESWRLKRWGRWGRGEGEGGEWGQ